MYNVYKSFQFIAYNSHRKFQKKCVKFFLCLKYIYTYKNILKYIKKLVHLYMFLTFIYEF